MNLNHATNKQNGSTLSATEWNNLAADVNELGAGGSGSGVVTATQDTNATDPTVDVAIVSGVTEVGSPNVIQLTKKSKGVNTTVVSGNNINIEPRESTGKAKNTKGGNISLKPGDDIELCSHHRRFGNRDEVTLKVIDGEDAPVKLQVKAANITLSTEGKATTMAKDEDTGLDTATPLYNDPNVMNVNVTTGSGKGYLKVRAQAIDLRCEDHGGIALQPKGEDSDHFENKIKFEHGGGDGLEFGTFNTQHTSLYTTDYRFKKDGVIRLANRYTEVSDKADANDPTTAYKYKKNDATNNAALATSESRTFDAADDFYDFVETSDPTCTWEDIVKFIHWAKTNKSGKDWDALWSA